MRQTRAVASTSVDLLSPVRRLSVEEYLRISSLGLFESGPRVELIDGVIVEMNAAEWPHRLAVMWLTRELVPQLDAKHILSAQQAISLPALRSMPEPDIAILDVAEAQQRRPDRPLLIIEVSDTSLRFDRITKGRLFARNGVEEYWIVNLHDDVIEVHREPAGDTWASHTVHGAGAVLRPVALPGVEVAVAELLAFTAGRA